MRAIAARLLGVILLSFVGGCCIRPIGGYYSYRGPAEVVCTEAPYCNYGSYYHRSAPHANATCPPSGVSTYRAPSHSPHPAPGPSHGPSGSHGGGHTGGNSGSPHPGSHSEGSHGGHR
jgi:hypothetical protein